MTGTPNSLRRKAFMQLCCAGILLPACYLLLRPQLDTVSWAQITASFGGIAPLNWSAAIAATCASFLAIGRYDVIVHRHLRTRQPARSAHISGAASVALSQFLGLGLVTGTIARWRALPDLTTAQASAVTVLVSISFLVAWLGLFGVSGMILPHSLPLPSYIFIALTSSCLLLVIFTVLRRHITWRTHRLRLPSLRAFGAMFGYAALDTVFAAIALWMLFPASAEIAFTVLLPIYLAGLGLALVSNTPGGVGPFEATLIWALSDYDVNALIAGVIAFRCLYYAAPALIAAVYLLSIVQPKTDGKNKSLHIIRSPEGSLHPEARVAVQGGGLLRAPGGKPLAPTYRTTQATVALFDPPAGFDALRPTLADAAAQRATWPLMYKIRAQNAVKARRAGWAVFRIAQDAIVKTHKLSDTGKARAGLRRKLRKAQAAGLQAKEIELNRAPGTALWDELRSIDAIWSSAHGGARGFSVGRFNETYIAAQRVFAVQHEETILAFVSFHCSAKGWVLDLMRHRQDIPDGAMHLAIWHALNVAKDCGVSEVSLASTPHAFAALGKRYQTALIGKAKGLAQFKRSFDPHWRPLYAAAPSKLILLLTLWDVWKEVQNPDPIKHSASIRPIG